MTSDDVIRFKVVGRRLLIRSDVYDAIEEWARQHGQTVEQWVEEAARADMERLKKEAGV